LLKAAFCWMRVEASPAGQEHGKYGAAPTVSKAQSFCNLSVPLRLSQLSGPFTSSFETSGSLAKQVAKSFHRLLTDPCEPGILACAVHGLRGIECNSIS
jgi:hypothetical protein